MSIIDNFISAMDSMSGAQAMAFVKTFLIVYFFTILFTLIYSAVVMILHSLGLYTIAMRRGIKHPWLAWLPVGNSWILGNIADQYRYVAKGQIANRRKLILGMYISNAVVSISMFVMMLAAIFSFMDMAMDQNMDEKKLVLFGILMLASYVALLSFYVITVVTEYVCYYDLYQSCAPNSATALIVLSIFFSFLIPFFVFALRKKDQGMPPRRRAPVAQVSAPQLQQSPAPAQEAPVEAPVQEVPVQEAPAPETPAEETAE